MKKLIVLLTALSLMIGIANAQVPSYVPSNGLVGWWPFNGNANDESGNGNNGVIISMPGGSVSSAQDRFGSSSSAISFTGNNAWNSYNSYVKIPQSNSFNFDSSFSMSLWILPSSSIYVGELINHGPDNLPNIISRLDFTINHELGFGSCGTNGCLINSNSISTSNWNMVTIVFAENNSTSTGIARMYLNGILISACNTSMCATYDYSHDLWFGLHQFGTNGSMYPYLGLMDDIGIWNRALDSCEIKDLYYASLGNCCSASFSLQPQSQNANSGANASFIAQSSSLNAIYQWQSNVGMGWQNLSNAGQYSGVTNDTLIVSNLALSNNNQLFRCILMSGTCTDTSATATLSVTATNGVYQLHSESINIYPNPANNQITILSNAARYPVTYKVYNELGQTILVGELKLNTTSLDISNLATGNYVLVVGTKHLRFVKNK